MNVKSILEAQSSSLEYVIKTICFLANMADFSEFNEIYLEFFGKNNPPARSCVEAARLPKDVLIEIEAIAFKSE